ncbi:MULTISPECIES: dihydrodipicolinate synthase family protein [Arthrobacter]|uniref:dihydrodipicolinate synthase family protein n=1 Tax=unclassified Arthrobacter TaxID=235627 RepID=UPI0024BB0B03|nr:dihydrodipicolinate synthase family protein [Arthrobacter sp. H35-MC1]MDJ0315949.1 dihydrodipicolinate synthase family protein [Arthrobacter sp. H35-MC1]
MTQLFSGLLAYPITPLMPDAEIDFAALTHQVRNAAQAGVNGVTVLATSGAGVSFDRGERHDVTAAAVDATASMSQPNSATVPVYVAISAASTREVVHLARDAQSAGAQGLLLAPFSYLPLSDLEVRSLFETVSDATNLPLCFYNKPVQTQYDVSPEMLAELAASANLLGVKETMRRPNVAERVSAFRDAVGSDFSIGLSADVQLLSLLPQVDAWHTGLAALLPDDYAEVWRSARAGTLQGIPLKRLLIIAQAVSESKAPLGALHALANILGLETPQPRGPFASASQSDVAALGRAVESVNGSK